MTPDDATTRKAGMDRMSHNHRRTSPRLATVAGALACVALIAGCGATDPAEKRPSQTGGSIEDQLGFTRNGITAAQAKVENEIATCMKGQGFDYIPGDPVAEQAALTGKPNMSDEEFERTYGHGIATLYGKGSTQSDPNARIRAQLGDADRRAYDRTLNGGRPEQTFAHAIDNGDFSQLAGCTKQATDAAFGGTKLLTTLQRKLDELDDSIVNDQRMVQANARWSTCMREATGEQFEDSEAVEDDIRKRLEAIVGEVLPPGEVAPEGSYDKAALAALARREVDLTRADLACEAKFVTATEDKVREEKETRFRDENAELLRQVKPLGS
jgi:hypothetical protein